VFSVYVPYPSAPPWQPAPPPRRSGLGLRITLVVLLVVALCAGAGDALLLVTGIGAGHRTAAFVGGDGALTELLSRRASAIIAHNEAAFLADVDRSDPKFVQRQKVEYENLVALGLSSFTLTLSQPGRYQVPSDAPLAVRHDGLVRRVGVTVRYAVAGLDTVPDAEPWIPTFVGSGGRWLLADEESVGASQGLPFGVGGLPWEARPVTVVRSAHVIAVISTEDAEIAPHLVDLAERGITNVMKIRKTGWSGKVLLTAVSDQKVFDAYFEGSPDKLAQIEAVTIPRYDEVPEWNNNAQVVLSRVVFNPATLGRGDTELQHTLTHEFTHTALGLVTSDATPRWLVEGMAEYVAYATEYVPAELPGEYARHVSATALPGDETFYDSADNYTLAWLAVKLIAQKYGQAKALALYDYFHDHTDVDLGFQQVLGTSFSAFTQAWLAYLDKVRAS